MTGFRTTAGPDLANGRYLGRVVEIETRHSDRFDSDFLIWHAEVMVGRDSPLIPVSGSSSVAWSSQSKAFAWAEAITGARLNPRTPPAFEDLYGQRVVVQVGRNDNDWATIVDLEPFTGDRTGIVGLAEPSTEPAPTPTPAPAETAGRVNGAAPGWSSPAQAIIPEPARLPDDLPF
jgi:hypothetical protein